MARFRARARTLDMLGRQQIAGIPTALHELFKNAYDAYAHNVEVDFFRTRELLLLRDDGVGMSREDFESRWLTLATESKVPVLENLMPSPRTGMKKRPVMGEKGIGRLAIATIGPIVLIFTRADEEQQITACLIHWGLFEIVGVDLEDIELPIETLDGLSRLDQALVARLRDSLIGTCNQIANKSKDPKCSKIRAELKQWDPPLKELANLGFGPNLESSSGVHFLIHPVREELIADIDIAESNGASNLERMLLGFSNSFSQSTDDPLNARFRDHLEDGQTVDRIADREFFTQSEYAIADHKVAGEFDKQGNFSGTISVYGEEPQEISIPLFNESQSRACGPFKLNFAYVQGSPSDTTIPYDMHVALKKKLDRIGGLYIYKNGIRVLPYGNSDYDFLEIERRRTLSASYYFFSYRRMFGAIETNAEQNPNLQEKAGREGFQSNRAYREFREQLMMFFEELAARFFREDGAYSENWELQRAALQKEYKLAQKRKRSAKRQRDEFAANLSSVLSRIESETYVSDLDEILNQAESRIQTLLKSNDLAQAARMIIVIERETYDRTDEIKQDYQLNRPRAVGLTRALTREWERYLELLETKIRPEFETFERKIAEKIGHLASDAKLHLDAKMRLEASIQSADERSKDSLLTEQRVTRDALQSTEVFVRSQLNEAKRLLQDTKDNVDQTIAGVNFQDVDENELEDLRVRLEATLLDTRKTLEERLNLIRLQLERVKEIGQGEDLSADQTISSLETELEVLREDYNQTLELAQLGMAVSIVQHEFESNVRGVRRSLRSMSKWAEKNQALKSLYNDIRDGFDHLDNYLSLFTPLDRRLRRRKTKITGEQIGDFIRDLFAERFERHGVDFQLTTKGATHSLESFSSVILPVFVNLVDNSIHWMAKKDGVRKLTLSAKGDFFILEDSGPGISAQDKEFIFEFGYTRKLGGQGMGLYIAKTSLNKDELDIHLDHKFRTGARFLIGPKDVS